MCHSDEAGFAMTLPTTYTWRPVGDPLRVPYEAPQGRRVNAIGATFTHGPDAGRFVYRTFAALPKNRSKTEGRKATRRTKTQEEVAAKHGLLVAEVGPIDAARFVDFVWEAAGRDEGAPAHWKRERPLMMVVDNYSVHHSKMVNDTREEWEAADIYLIYLPSYCPQLSKIEPVWNDVKHHYLPIRSFERVADLKHNVDAALARKAEQLKQTYTKPTKLLRLTT